MNESAIQAILAYRDEHLFEPEMNWPKYWFDQRSYSRWSANEILKFIIDRPFTPAVEIVEDFALKMEHLLYVSEDKASSSIFSIARDTAADILDIFRAME